MMTPPAKMKTFPPVSDVAPKRTAAFGDATNDIEWPKLGRKAVDATVFGRLTGWSKSHSTSTNRSDATSSFTCELRSLPPSRLAPRSEMKLAPG